MSSNNKPSERFTGGQSVASLSRELGVGESQLHKWKKLKIDSGSDLEKENLKLKKRLRELAMENEILKNVWLRHRSQLSSETFWHQAGRMQQMYPASVCEGFCLRALMESAP